MTEHRAKLERRDRSGRRAIRSAEIMTAVVLTVMALLVCFTHAGSYELDETAVDGAYQMTVPSSVRQMAQELNQQRESALIGSVEIQINGEPQVDAGSGRCSLLAGNPAGNTKNLQVTITLDGEGQDGTEKVIYRSPLLKPGDRVVYVTLDRSLDPGQYPATAEFTVLDPETGAAIGVVDAGILLTVSGG